MANELRSVPAIRRILGLAGGYEVSIRWDEDGILCKARLDFIAPGDGVVLDYKTTRDASPTAFARSAANFRYNRQQAWYTRGLEALGIPIYDFVFAAQEKITPFAAAAYTIPSHAVEAGQAEAMSRLVEYVAARESGSWPAYGGESTIELEWPAWADSEYQEEDYNAR
jgi:exodeoxyribonuclease VIII